jgi:lysine 2,3-aminomutase
LTARTQGPITLAMPLDSKPRAQATQTLRTAASLEQAGLIAPDQAVALERVAREFAVAVSPAMASLIDPADPADPIGRQFLPSEAELVTTLPERADPIGDDAHAPLPGIVHRYEDRVLLKLTHVCPVYCRFCFRREKVGPRQKGLTPAELACALAYIKAHPEIWEVILTGGDPLVLSARRLADVVGRIEEIAHVGVIRFHTRVPVAAPERITRALTGALKARRAASWMILHCNHWRELSPAALQAIGRLVDAGIPLLSQTVLLRGINDDAATLTRTFRALVAARVKPHYLHHGDLARGTSHFRTSLAAGRALVRALRGDVSGLCQPTYVLDIPGGHGKVPAAAPFVTEESAGGWQVCDPRGNVHAYRDD